MARSTFCGILQGYIVARCLLMAYRPMNYGFDKQKLPRGFSFALKRSALDVALTSAGITHIHVVYYWFGKSGDFILRADFCGEGNVGWAAAGQASITLYAVPAQ